MSDETPNETPPVPPRQYVRERISAVAEMIEQLLHDPAPGTQIAESDEEKLRAAMICLQNADEMLCAFWSEEPET